MTTKTTDRSRLMAFEQQGIDIFNQVEDLLQRLITDAAEVEYTGANAYEFKSKCVGYAVDFANTTSTNMGKMADAISSATTFIATNLGGDAINLEPPTVVFAEPPIPADTSVESAEDGPLLELRSNVEAKLSSIEQLFTDNLANLEALAERQPSGAGIPLAGWEGPEYDATVTEVRAYNTVIQTELDTARTNISTAITEQLQALGMGG